MTARPILGFRNWVAVVGFSALARGAESLEGPEALKKPKPAEPYPAKHRTYDLAV